MTLLNKELFEQLAQSSDTPSISLYLPLETEADKHDKNRIRLKNHLTAAAERLQEAYDLSAAEVTEMLQPAEQMIANARFSTDLELDEGMAIFLSPEVTEIHTLPISFTEQLIITNHFYLTPLLPLLMNNGRYYILALSQNEIRLLQASAHTIEQVTLDDDIPTSLSEALKWEDPEAQSQWHTNVSPHARHSRQAVFHGHGVTNQETQKEEIREYFRRVAAGIDALLKEEKAPLVLAGVNYLLPIYREVSHYPHLLENGVPGNPEQLAAQTLQEQTWAIVAPHFEEAHQAAATRFANAAGSDMVTDELEKVIVAAHYGQVESLFLNKESQYWGVFDATQGTVQRGSSADHEPQELLERTAVQTYLHGGTVYVLPGTQMPSEANAAALLRAPLHTSA